MLNEFSAVFIPGQKYANATAQLRGPTDHHRYQIIKGFILAGDHAGQNGATRMPFLKEMASAGQNPSQGDDVSWF